jgi:hypothetical protein
MLSTEWCTSNTDLDRDDIIPVFSTNVSTADRAEDLSFGPGFLSEALVMDIVDRLQKVLTSLSYDGPLFNDATQIDQGLRQAKSWRRPSTSERRHVQSQKGNAPNRQAPFTPHIALFR